MNETEWYGLLCKAMGWPFTPWTVAGLKAWARKESPEEENGQTRLFNRCWNPLATTYMGADAPRSPEDIGFGAGKWNNANPPQGVGIYATPEAGVAATANTIRLSFYPIIRATFLNQAVGDTDALRSNFQTWIGSAAYSHDLTEYLRILTASKEPFGTPPVVAADPVAEMNRWMLMRFDILGLAALDDARLLQVHRYLAKGGSVPDREGAKG